MKLTIDNGDGFGPIDYGGAISHEGRLHIERTLNAPSRCTCELVLGQGSLPTPQRKGRVVVSSDDGTVLFTGYIATTPEAVLAGESMGAPLYQIAVGAISDEWLLDRQNLAGAVQGLSQPAGMVLRTLTTRASGGTTTTNSVAATRDIGVFTPDVTRSWSTNAAVVAAAAYSGYRVVSGALSLLSAGSVVHGFSDGDGTLLPQALRTTQVKELANDVTLTGEVEPATYVTELFEGDGTTAVFKVSAPIFHPAARSGGEVLLNDSFARTAINESVWRANDPGAVLSFGSAGLTLNGGDGQDGGTTLTAVGPIEMGGTLLIEVGGVTLSTASEGVLGGLYSGPPTRGTCVAGFDVRQAKGATVVTPLVNGVDVGTAIPLLIGHTYTLRLRLHCQESQRVEQIFYAMVEGAVQSFGGALAEAAMQVAFEVQDLGLASTTPSTLLYDGVLASAPAVCVFTLVNCEQMFGSINFCRITQQGSVWITSTPPSGQTQTRLIGIAGEGVDCRVSTDGTITFFAGRVPVAGELMSVRYRLANRSVARLADPGSVATESTSGLSGTAQWLGKVANPVARSSADCENAAAALLGIATSPDAALSGQYTVTDPGGDIWPGDVLALTQNGVTRNVLVRKVGIADGGASPELATYELTFANDWAEAVGLKVTEAISMDAVLPAEAKSVAGEGVLPSLAQLQVLTASSTALQIDAGMAPPAGGGFEVRRRDGLFSLNSDQDLVLRTPVRSFSIPREAQVERYYVRQYDGSATPAYSRFSSAVFTNLPTG